MLSVNITKKNIHNFDETKSGNDICAFNQINQIKQKKSNKSNQAHCNNFEHESDHSHWSAL